MTVFDGKISLGLPLGMIDRIGFMKDQVVQISRRKRNDLLSAGDRRLWLLIGLAACVFSVILPGFLLGFAWMNCLLFILSARTAAAGAKE